MYFKKVVKHITKHPKFGPHNMRVLRFQQNSIADLDFEAVSKLFDSHVSIAEVNLQRKTLASDEFKVLTQNCEMLRLSSCKIGQEGEKVDLGSSCKSCILSKL